LDEQLGAVERAAGDGITQPEARAVKPGFSSPRRRRGF
jgi:hypothetical protein